MSIFNLMIFLIILICGLDIIIPIFKEKDTKTSVHKSTVSPTSMASGVLATITTGSRQRPFANFLSSKILRIRQELLGEGLIHTTL